MQKYFHHDTVAFGKCGCHGDARCKEYWQAVDTWRQAAEFAARRGKPRDTWRSRWWHAEVRLHELRALRPQIVQRIQRSLVEEYRHWLTAVQPSVDVAQANVVHVLRVAQFATQGYADTQALKQALEEAITMKAGGQP